ncbi:hypothetical protein HS088_TW04G01089 [Tripterygium wilfordii]|uniref:Serine aminopeptidase S33 domain-containing protein n=1 Tax=Tripterygium wilfordii TaxID=458696 RepID=A0A7J7DSM1_TRIWF|nr:hypothetical protein HS088_TW04G01089 [Tripterygium wilfordii]
MMYVLGSGCIKKKIVWRFRNSVSSEGGNGYQSHINGNCGRYAQFAKQLTTRNFGVSAMDWIGLQECSRLSIVLFSCSDNQRNLTMNRRTFLEKVQTDNPGIPGFLFGHSTGGAVVLKEAARNSNGKAAHSEWRNYDDFYESLWFVQRGILITFRSIIFV